jgi:hypothetical protein
LNAGRRTENVPVINPSRSLNVLKKLEKALNHEGFWPFLFIVFSQGMKNGGGVWYQLDAKFGGGCTLEDFEE